MHNQNDKISILIAVGGRAWFSPQGQQRIYFNNLPALYGAALDIDAKGKPVSGTFLGQPIPPAQVPGLYRALTTSRMYYLPAQSDFVWQAATGTKCDMPEIGAVIRESLRRLIEARQRGAI